MRAFTSFAIPLIALAAACGSKKQEAPAAGVAAPPPPAAPPREAPPAKPLPGLEADPGGATGKVDWVTSIGGVKIDVVRAIAVNAEDATFIAGDFEDAAKFAAAGERKAAGKSDAFVGRVDPRGTVEWVTTLGGKNEERVGELAVDDRGNVAIGGLFSDKLTAGELTATAVGSDDLFVAGVDRKGEVQWLWSAGGDASDETTALAAFPGGGWIAAVSFAKEAKLGNATLTSRGGHDAALVKLGAGGEVEWAVQLGGEYNDQVEHLALDANGNVFVLGRFGRTIDLGGAVLEGKLPSDLFLARFDGAGKHVWSKAIGNPFEEVAGGIAVDQAGGIAITGSYDKDLDFLGTPLNALGESDVFVARLDGDGKLRWVKSFGAERADLGQTITIDRAGNVIVAGWFETTINFGGKELKSKGYKDGWIAKLGPAGQHVWSRRFGDWDVDGATAVAVAHDGAVRLAGIYRYSLDLITPGGSTAVQSEGQKFAKADSFLARLAR